MGKRPQTRSSIERVGRGLLGAAAVIGVALALSCVVSVGVERNPHRPEFIVFENGIITWGAAEREYPRVPSLSKEWGWLVGLWAWPVWEEQVHLAQRSVWLWPIPLVFAAAGSVIQFRGRRGRLAGFPSDSRESRML